MPFPCTIRIHLTQLKQLLILTGTLFLLFSPNQSYGCACGCGVFDVGTNAMFPTAAGGMAFFEYNFLDQNQNRSGNTASSANNNSDKEIKTSFYKVGVQYLLNRNWGLQAEIPYWSRSFTTLDNSGNPATYTHTALGDIRVKGIYTGFSEDMSTGLTFGFKLPTGNSTYINFDPDTEIGSGSTDLLLGIYHLWKIGDQHLWSALISVNLDQPILATPNYIPGNELDTAFGVYYEGWEISQHHIKISPIAELIASVRGSDNGANADPIDSGFRRLLGSPGFEINFGSARLYSDIQVPLYTYYNGNQLQAPIAYKLAVMVDF